MTELNIFHYNYELKPFSTLKTNFWDSLQQIGKNHQIICNHILKELSEDDKKENNKDILKVTESLKILVQADFRYFYIEFLKFNFILSEPLTVGQLKKNFINKIFPYYLFTLLTKKKKINHMIIDLIEKKIQIYKKDKKLETIRKENIMTLMKENNNTIVITLNSKNITNNKMNNIEIIPEFNIQSDLIYILISFMMQMDECKRNTENKDYSILEDDTYIPKGIILKAYILKIHQKKILSKDKRFAVLGPSQIIIFKNSNMKEIKNIIPLIFFGIQIKYKDKENIIKFKYFNRKLKIQFLDNNTYIEWKSTLENIFSQKIKVKIDGINLYKLREKELNKNIIDEINQDIKNIEEKIKSENNEIENYKQEIIKDMI